MRTQVISNKAVVGFFIGTIILALFPFYSSAATAKLTNKSVDLSCMQDAVSTREDGIAAAFTTFNEDVEEALAARKTALVAAWGIEDKVERSKAIKTAWADWKTAKKAAHTELKAERKQVWADFKTTAKTTCRITLPKEEGLEKDSSGSISL
ncbi:hypothetical protein A3I99_03960 [Candidatus Kaiserbacteria bacterium RIFCSPLOWO2_02_FULL_45_11b]|uniref:Uncharacterized protein n=1 Tax=Candidatus Kaiserbacteria bacterium RIFCSPLOWO2_12_FULL_45_26 TaxID=1798525 RepID=A0A1F6FHD2_9BACT|nr:MAG: hypothetical protein A2Z56_01355 [Candidatus Kaiserbacteria bacterium RIFCSPHIGHO2_12_45_16]OGG70873.1 MAG: hypothetical protein A2929_02840 [Candidatus Kaiserbacteria bacterium RIFCSPLOWO2_01_FULL_45_25]OGG83741.1 MAG: hypothetical protein A3I99_03960 [Candidatus Kaiserbacteria bacterium RIFCSPLOWO2_02_FULL_45_11b]OGG85236.1 MAG: hypothetical protein A3G90_04240 [Candidatus Kaiserbacteria bacterium RIFCSPLOWO2_12_FULL_45_26]